MTKYIFPFLAALFLAAPLSAQHFGLRVGLNATDAKYDFDNSEIETDGETNLMLGVFANLPLVGETFSIQPEFTYLNRGYSVGVDFGDLVAFDRTVSYVDLGVLARLNFGADEGLGFYVGAGPQFSYAVSGTRTDILGERDVDFDSERLNRGELQFAGVAGLTFNAGLRFFVEGRYNGSLGNQSDDNRIDIKQRSIGVNGGVMVPF
jgi:opacity protein-like surface antigen